jgi:quinohemoprotein ethanol dehydrogenase
VLNPPPAFGTAEVVARGQEIYGRLCVGCHGSDGFSRGMFPDLRYSGAIHSAEAFKAIVVDGALAQNGMVSFAKALQPNEPEAIRAYVVARANELKNAPPQAQAASAPAPAAPAPRNHAD